MIRQDALIKELLNNDAATVNKRTLDTKGKKCVYLYKVVEIFTRKQHWQ